MIYSTSNQQLSQIEYNATLFEFDYIKPIFKAIIDKSEAASQSTTTTSILISIISNPSAAWALISTIQLVALLPLSENALPATITNFCKAIRKYNMFPNIFKLLVDKDASTDPYHQAQKVGINSSIFLLSAGSDLTVLIIILCFLPVIIIFSKVNLGKISSKLREKLHEYRYNVLIRFWIQTYLNFGIFAIINHKSVKSIKEALNGGATHFTSRIFSIIYLVIFKQLLFLTTPVALLVGLYINFDLIKNNRSPIFVRRYGSVIGEFDQGRGLKCMLFYPIFTLRRILYAFSQIYLNDSPIIQKSSNLTFGILSFLYLIVTKPYKNKLILVSNCVNEGLICLIFAQILLMHFNTKLLSEDSLNWIFISLLMACLGFNYIISLIGIASKIKDQFKKLTKNKNSSLVNS